MESPDLTPKSPKEKKVQEGRKRVSLTSVPASAQAFRRWRDDFENENKTTESRLQRKERRSNKAGELVDVGRPSSLKSAVSSSSYRSHGRTERAARILAHRRRVRQRRKREGGMLLILTPFLLRQLPLVTSRRRSVPTIYRVVVAGGLSCFFFFFSGSRNT